MRVLHLSAKCNDMCCVDLVLNGQIVKEYDGYVPSNMGIGDGDYIRMSIDLDTGQILDWTPPSQEDLDEFIKSGE